MLQVCTVWRWIRLPVIVIAVLALAGGTWTAWMLTDQRYQHFLTQQLSDILDAEVQVDTSHITFWRGLGIALEHVAVQEHTSTVPLFTADAVEIFLDVFSLLRGQFDFRQIVITRPELQVIEGVTQEALLRRVRRQTQQQQRSQPQSTGWFAPRFIVHHLAVRKGLVVYRRTVSPTPLYCTAVDATFTHAENGPTTVQLQTWLGQQGDLGTIHLYTYTQGESAPLPFAQQQWRGEVSLTDTQVQQIGRQLGYAWPQAILSFSGQYHGQWSGPIELAGQVDLRAMQLGAGRIESGTIYLDKVVWPKQGTPRSSSGWAESLRTLTIHAHMQDIHSVVGDLSLPVVIQRGTATLNDQTLTMADLQGRAGHGSQLRDGTATITSLFGAAPPTLEMQLSVRLDLAKDAQPLLARLPATNNATPLTQTVQAQGDIVAQLRVRTKLGAEQKAQYDGNATLQEVAIQLPTFNVTVSGISGIVHISPDTLTTSALNGKVNNAPITVRGNLHNYQSPQREGELQLTFSDIPDHTVAAFLPERLVVANGGLFSGKAALTLAPGKTVQTAGAVQLRGVQLDPLTFLRPFTIAEGEMHWQGQSGTFTVSTGQLVDSAFSGYGHFSSITPLQLDFSLDFPTLNVLPAIARDHPRNPAQPKKSTTIIKANVTCGECIYKTAHVRQLRLAVHWHDRQADIDVVTAQIAKGIVQGQMTVWPDLGALFFAPQLAGVDVQSFFQAVDRPSEVFTGNATGNGKVYVEDWRRWANPAYWDAVISLTIADGVARRVPLLVRLWSAVSLQGILRLQLPELPSEGLPFSTLSGDLAFGRGQAVTKNVTLDGSAVRIETSGELNLVGNTVDLLVQLVLLHGVTSTLEWVPLVGELLARGTDLLTTFPFRVTGSYTDPTVVPAFMSAG